MSGSAGNNGLVLAIIDENIDEVLKRLNNTSIELDMVDEYGKTPLMHAAVIGNDQILTMLIDAGSDVNPELPPALASPLLESVIGGHTKCVRALLLAKADRSATMAFTDGQYTSLELANSITIPNAEIIRLLSTNLNELIKETPATTSAMAFRETRSRAKCSTARTVERSY